jgi:hypothetical protein
MADAGRQLSGHLSRSIQLFGKEVTHWRVSATIRATDVLKDVY